MRCDPLRDLRAWQERLERLHQHEAAAWTPPIDIYETADRYVITAEVPGVSREQITVAMDGNCLTLSGSRPAAAPDATARHYHQVERGHGQFVRTFEFAEAVSIEDIAADLRDGVLTVTLPKKAQTFHRIQVG
jgi:HSP20 family protein